MNTNPLIKLFYHNKGRQIYKWTHYLDIYHQHFKAFRHKPVTIVEFGVLHGGSLQMWKKYFGRRARIVGVDIEPRCKQFEEKHIEIMIGDQEDRAFLKRLRKEIGPVDIIIDDGGHVMNQQITTFEEMWPGLKEGGVYLIEDLHTSYWKMYGGGLKKRGTFIEFAKELIDSMHAWHAQKRDAARFPVNRYTRSIKAMHIYGSVIVMEKDKIVKPHDEQHGDESDIDFSFLGYGPKK